MMTGDQNKAVRLVRVAIQAVARDTFGSRVVRPATVELLNAPRDVEPLPGLRAAVLARQVATRCVGVYASAARGEGSSWDAIGQALGVEDGEALAGRAERAYLHVVAGVDLRPEDPIGGRPVLTHWRCTSCEQYVTDHGPFDANPATNEGGHAPDCARHAADIAAYLNE